MIINLFIYLSLSLISPFLSSSLDVGRVGCSVMTRLVVIEQECLLLYWTNPSLLVQAAAMESSERR